MHKARTLAALVGFSVGAVAAGGYRLAYQLSQSLVRLSDLFARGIFPEFARIGIDAADGGVRALFWQSARLALGVGLAICILAPLLGKPILWLIGGSDYIGLYPVLVLLGIAAGLEVMAAGFEPVLIATGHAGTALRIRAVSVAALGVMLATLLNAHGIIAAGVAALVSSAINLVLFVRAARKAID